MVLLYLPAFGNLFSKVKDNTIDTKKASKRFMILLIVLILIIVFETNYIGEFITTILNV